jgi:phenylacetic acid degradation operon negative regulatory protein
MASSFSHEDILPDVAVGDVRFPRARTGNAPQSLAVMLLAEFGLQPRAWFPSAAVVALLNGFDITTVGARAVVHRLARRGVLEGRKDGRRTSYRLTQAAAAALIRGGHALATFPERAEAWDGGWTLVVFSAPHSADSERAVLRARLRWRGFAPLYDGVWVAPQEPADLADNVLARAADVDVSMFRAREIPLDRAATRNPLTLWDLDGVTEAYGAFLRRWEAMSARAWAGAVIGAEAVRIRAEVEDDYRRFVVLDPRLPLRVMPQAWPRAHARELFATIYDGLLAPALSHVHEVVARFADDPPPRISAYSTSDLAAGVLLPAAIPVRDGDLRVAGTGSG